MQLFTSFPAARRLHLERWFHNHQQQLVRAGIIIAVLLLSAFFGVPKFTKFAAVFVGLGGVLLFVYKPELALILTILGGFAIPFYGPSGLNITMLGVTMLLGLWLLEAIVVRRSLRIANSIVVKPALGFVLITVLALVLGRLPWYPTTHAPLGAQIASLWLTAISIGVLLWMGNQLNDLRWLKWLTWGFLAYAFLHIISWLEPSAGNYLSRLFQYGSTGSLFWTWIVALSSSQALFNRRLPLPARAALGLLALLSIAVGYIYLNDWKSGWFPALASVAAMLMFASWRYAVALSILGTVPAMQLLARALTNDAYSYSTRVDAWVIVLSIAKVNPILGLGPANYYWYTPLFPIRGYAVQFNSHNQYIDLIAQTGILGLLCFVWIFWELARLCWRLRNRVPEGFARAYVCGAFGGLVGMLVAAALGDWVLPFFYNVGLNGFRASALGWVFLGGLLAIERLTVKPAEDPDSIDGAGEL